MPRAKGQTDSVQGWFREYYRAHPETLKTRSNAEVIDAWKAAHEGQEFGTREKNAMSNVKSMERKALKKGKGKRGPGRPRKDETAGVATEPRAPKGRPSIAALEHLEQAIDACLTTARHLGEDNADMKDVARHLRAARNRVVWIQGE